MKINDDMKKVLEGTAFLSLVTVGADGTPHPIIAGEGKVVDDTIVFGIYKMEVTQKNLAADSRAWVVGATMDGGPHGYRFAGTAKATDKQLVFTPASSDVLI
ncbi:MAG: pyridoxamine 5'-phosphate oxidase family protein [Clostridiales Family XIII bacterium]|jgi:hypothetical protein|nr:pyridoxamine 5'-phosphate oxidase family protein [Clostridiales Family XIII bacterium]